MIFERNKLTSSLHNGISVVKLGENNIKQVLDAGCLVLAENNYDYWVSAGTLLGFVRDNKFLEWDTDIDVDYGFDAELGNPDSPMIVKNMIAQFEKCGMKIGRTMFYDGNPMQAAFIGESNIIFDIYFYYLHNNQYINLNEHGLIVFPYDTVKPTTIMEFVGGHYPVPGQCVEYIKQRYGQTWNTPIPGGKSTNVFFWNQGKVEWE
jgi:hypothetical protein